MGSGPLPCKKCRDSTLEWVADEDGDFTLDSDMRCKKCGHIYRGMQDYIDYNKENEVDSSN
jgi:uncharacterized C2H2 Zn-finger protein